MSAHQARIAVNELILLSEFRPSDKPVLVAYLNDPDISMRTLRIPFSYTEKDADEWLALTERAARQQGVSTQWAIRDASDALLGGCGFDGLEVGTSHKAELGYWLAKPFWNKGIMTAVVQRLCRHAFEELGLKKITAHVFAQNQASVRVLEKCGFQEEGFLRKHYFKDGNLLDARLFGLLKC